MDATECGLFWKWRDVTSVHFLDRAVALVIDPWGFGYMIIFLVKYGVKFYVKEVRRWSLMAILNS